MLDALWGLAEPQKAGALATQVMFLYMDMMKLRRIFIEFEEGRLSDVEFAGLIGDFCESHRNRPDADASAGEFAARLEEFALRVEMIQFGVCAAERRGALLDLLADFRASLQI
jgi:hypothetical protein